MRAFSIRSFLAAAIILTGAVLHAAAAENATIAKQRLHEKKTFTDTEITDGFMRTAFGAEYHLAGRIDRIRKYDSPVKVFIAGSTLAKRRAQLAEVIADIARRVRHIDLGTTATRNDANVVITLVRDRDLYKTIHTLYGAQRAKEIRRSLDPQCLSGFRKNERYEIEHSDVILTVDNGDFVFLDCAYEEVLQSLGPINDTDAVPWTMFNDDVSMGFFDVYDQYILNILYDPRIKPGMTVQEVQALLPAILPDVREWVAKVNDLKP
jgi:hypothetical protein